MADTPLTKEQLREQVKNDQGELLQAQLNLQESGAAYLRSILVSQKVWTSPPKDPANKTMYELHYQKFQRYTEAQLKAAAMKKVAILDIKLLDDKQQPNGKTSQVTAFDYLESVALVSTECRINELYKIRPLTDDDKRELEVLKAKSDKNDLEIKRIKILEAPRRPLTDQESKDLAELESAFNLVMYSNDKAPAPNSPQEMKGWIKMRRALDIVTGEGYQSQQPEKAPMEKAPIMGPTGPGKSSMLDTPIPDDLHRMYAMLDMDAPRQEPASVEAIAEQFRQSGVALAEPGSSLRAPLKPKRLDSPEPKTVVA